MKKSILVTGESGSGKSEVGRRLKTLGYETHDLDTIDEVCVMVDKITGLPTPYDNGNDIEKMEKMRWLYKKEELRDFVSNQKSEIAFYSGNPNNLEEILPLFTTIVLLIASAENTRQRLTARTDNGFGKSPEVQDYILNRKEKMEKNLLEKGVIAINSDEKLETVVADVLSLTNKLS